MRIAYDISVLGIGHANQRARTGIFRVVENVAYGLEESEECEPTFFATDSFTTLYQSLQYLESNRRFKGIPFACSKVSRIKRLFYEGIRNLNARIDSKKTPIFNQIYLRPFRKSAFLTNQIFERFPDSVISNKYLDGNKIFHTPFCPIPKEVQQKKELKKFITVYDLIPLLFPHFFEFNEDHLLKQVVEGITPDTYVLSISHATKNDLCNYSNLVDPEKVFVTHLAASELFHPCTDAEVINATKLKYGIPLDTPYILSLSTLEPRKNIDQTIRCFAQLVQQEKISDLNLVLVGTKGWDYSKIFEEISKYGDLSDRIIITGYVADEDLAAIYSGAQMFVYPSFYEGFGLPPLEAMQCGVPVITSNTSSLPEVVGDAGITVGPTDTDALCQSMLKLFSDASLRAEMAEKSIKQAEKFSWQTCVQQTIGAYKTALNH